MRSLLLSILIPTLSQRRRVRASLFANLERQVSKNDGRAELLWLEDAGNMPSGMKRNALMRAAGGEYLAFVDDDDMVDDRYVNLLLNAIESEWPDVVTFDMALTVRYKRQQRIEFRLCHNDNATLPGGVVGMSANHLCAWRRSIARRVGFPPHLGYNDDVFWYTPLLASGLAQREAHVPEMLYDYRWSRTQTMNQSRASQALTFQWAAGGVNAYWWRGEIVMAVMGCDHGVDCATMSRFPGQPAIRQVIDCLGCDRYAPVDELTLLCTVEAR